MTVIRHRDVTVPTSATPPRRPAKRRRSEQTYYGMCGNKYSSEAVPKTKLP